MNSLDDLLNAVKETSDAENFVSHAKFYANLTFASGPFSRWMLSTKRTLAVRRVMLGADNRPSWGLAQDFPPEPKVPAEVEKQFR
jgi:hypothetical protein